MDESLTHEDVEKFARLLAGLDEQGWQALKQSVTDLGDDSLSGRQLALDADFQRRKAALPRGSLTALTNLQVEHARASEALRRPPAAKPEPEKLSPAELRERYEADLAKVRRGDLKSLTELQARYRQRGLNV